MTNYSLSDVERILILDRNQRFLWDQYNFSTPKITSSALISIKGQVSGLKQYSDVFASEIRSLERLAETLEKRIDDSMVDVPAF